MKCISEEPEASPRGAQRKFKWPERLEIVAELPVTKMGKLDKKALRDMLARRSTP